MKTNQRALELSRQSCDSHDSGNMLNGLPSLQPQLNGISAAPPARSKACQGVRYSINRKKSGRSKVVRLLRRCCPSTVILAVALIAINPINRRSCRSWSHVVEEGSKRLPPHIANSNPFCSVPTVSAVVGIVATLLHLIPDAILWGGAQAMSYVNQFKNFATEASARRRVASCELSCRHKDFGSTVTHALPSSDRLPIGICSWGSDAINCQASEPMGFQVEWFSHA